MGEAGGLGMGCQWLAGLVSPGIVWGGAARLHVGGIMIGSSDNSGGVVVGILVCGTECSGFNIAFCFDLSLVEIWGWGLGTRLPSARLRRAGRRGSAAPAKT